MPKPALIGLWSPCMQSGKTTTATLLFSHGYRRASFATPLKEMVVTLMHNAGIKSDRIKEYVYGDRKSEPIPELGGKTARFILQTLGTEWGRNLIASDLWTSMAGRYIRTAGCRLVFDDLRLPNEADLIESLGGELWKITRPGVADSTGHSSEGALANRRFAREIVNDGSLEGLVGKIKAIIAQ